MTHQSPAFSWEHGHDSNIKKHYIGSYQLVDSFDRTPSKKSRKDKDNDLRSEQILEAFNGCIENSGTLASNKNEQTAKFETDAFDRTSIHNYLAKTKSSSQSISFVRKLLQRTNAKAMVHKDCQGMTPLHYACSSQSDPKILKEIIEIAPLASSIPDSNGNLPLHHYIGCFVQDGSACAKAISILNQSNPSALSTRNDEGDIPLHLLCKKWHPDEIGDALLRANKETVKITDAQGRLPLAIACEWRVNHKLIITMCELYPEAASQKDLYGDVPLHILCRTYPEDIPDKAIFLALAKASPRMIAIPNADGTLPIQTACEWILATSKVVLLPESAKFFHWPHFLSDHMCSLEILVCFLKAAPEVASAAVDFMNKELKRRKCKECSHLVTALALEFLIKASSSSYENGVSFKIPKCNEDFQFSDRRLLLRAALTIKNPLSYEAFMILFGDQWTDMKDLVKQPFESNDNTLPLHEAVQAGEGTDSRIIRHLLRLCPESAKMTDSNNMIPIRCAVENRVSFDSFKVLFDANPSPVIDSSGNDPLKGSELALSLTAALNDSDVDVIFFLLQNNPSIVQLNQPF